MPVSISFIFKEFEISESIDMSISLKKIGVSKEMLDNSIRYAKRIPNRYGLLQMLFDLSLYE